MSQEEKKYGDNRIGSTENRGSKGNDAGEMGARKIDEFKAGITKYDVNDYRQASRSERKRLADLAEQLYKRYRMDYEEYCYNVEMAGEKPKSEKSLKRAPIGTQSAPVRTEYIKSVEARHVNGTFDRSEYTVKVTAAGGTPKGAEEIDSLRAQFIDNTETEYINGSITYNLYCRRTIKAGGTPKSENVFDRQ